jgi:hypothetical protein
MNRRIIKENINYVNEFYKAEDTTTLHELKHIIQKTGTIYYDHQTAIKFKLLLTVHFN